MWRVASVMLVGGLLLAAGARADEPITTMTPAPSPDPHLRAEPWRRPPEPAPRHVGAYELTRALMEVTQLCGASPLTRGLVTMDAHRDGTFELGFDPRVPTEARACIRRFTAGWVIDGGIEVSVSAFYGAPPTALRR